MTTTATRKLSRAARNIPNLLQGFNLYVNRDKLRLIDLVFRDVLPRAASFADLGGVWRVNAAYTRYTMRRFRVTKAALVDTDIPGNLARTLARHKNLELIRDDFGKEAVVDRVGSVDAVYLFDVLLHQANPDWDEILRRYAANTRCFVVYNQQFVGGSRTERLTDRSMEEYIALTSNHAKELIRTIYLDGNKTHPSQGKPWRDIHNVIQWGITDEGLREVMARLGFTEVFYRSYGMFLDLPAFEEHGFIFLKQ